MLDDRDYHQHLEDGSSWEPDGDELNEMNDEMMNDEVSK
jgi:hypothetical protein